MSKYWKSITFGVMTIIVLTLFYVNNANYSKQLPQFSIEKTDGEAETLDNLAVDAQYYYAMNGVESIRVDQAGTNYLRDENYFKRLEGFSQGPEIEQWQQDFRSFMRGKNAYEGHFLETDKELTYANVIADSSFSWEFDTFEIHILDKTTNKDHYFTVNIPEYTKYRHQDILYTHVNNDEFTIVTEGNYDEDKMNKVDVNRYTFNTETEVLIEEERIYETTLSQSEQIDEEIFVHTSDRDNDYFIIEKQKNVFEDIESPRGEITDVAHSLETKALIKYNAETKKKEEIDLPKEIEKAPFIGFDDTTYYFTDITTSNVTIIPYVYKDDNMLETWEVDVKQPEDASWGTYATLKDNKLYYLDHRFDEATLPDLYVIDLEKEQLTFKGEVTTKEPIKGIERYDFQEIFVY